MAVARVQYKDVYSGAAATFDSNVTAGNLIVVGHSGNTGVDPQATCSDSLGNTYTLIVSAAPGSDTKAYLFYAYNITGGACTVTIANYRTDSGLCVVEYSGVKSAADPLDGSGSLTGSNDPMVASVVLTEECLVVAYYANEVHNRYSAPASGYTLVVNNTGHYHTVVEDLSAPAGTESAGVDLTSGSSGAVVVAAGFKLPAGVGGSVVPVLMRQYRARRV